MKISSKSILSPSRARESSQISLSTSLSRRLKTSGSLKGGQASPMFPTGGKKRGCAFENPEPSSPKVTCIGQVRVKTKKQGKKMRAARSQKRRANSSEPSFRKSEQQQIQLQLNTNNDQQSVTKQYLHQNSINGGGGGGGNQKWVHLPFTICEAVRAFGAELNCFLPCNSSCTNHKDKEMKGERSSLPSSDNESSCGTVFGRWLVAVQDGDGKGREIELVVEDEEEKENNGRKHVFEGLDFEEKIKNEVVEEEEEEVKEKEKEEDSRISICIPPKNALLLMRCRSDPVKMAELAKRFCESSVPKVEEEDENEEEEEVGVTLKEAKIEVPVIVNKIEEEEEEEEEEEKMVEVNEKVETEEEMREDLVFNCEEEKEQLVVEDGEVDLILQQENDENREIETENEINEQQVNVFVNQNQDEEEEDKFAEEIMAILTSCCESEATPETEQLELTEEKEEESIKLVGIKSEEDEEEWRKEKIEEDGDSDNGEKPTSDSLSVHREQEKEINFEEEEEEEQKATHEEEVKNEEQLNLELDQSKERETQERESSVLPDCLLLMMYEPKLSMEVSKETWVCSTDFIRCVPTREKKTQNEKTNGRDPPKKRVSIDRKPSEIPHQSIQPPRWSCSFPAPAAMGTGISMATMIEQKLVSAKGYEPLVLKRCKSEPMRSSAKVAQVQDACFWKDRKLEPHRPATFGVGVGAAGLGF